MAAETMSALQMNAYGGPEVLELVEIPIPQPRAHQVRVQVEAAGLNYSDIMIRENKYLSKVEAPALMGREFAGRIDAIGEAVQGWTVGQRVVGMSNGGAFAPYVATAAQGLFPVPEGMSSEVAVAALVQGITALYCLDECGRLQSGEAVLIHAAAGGVGSLALQIAALRGAQVIGTASSAEKCAFIEELGGQAVNYSQDDWVEQVMALTSGRGADLIIESVGGAVFLKSFREALAPLGRLVVMGAASAEVAKLANVEILGSGKQVTGFFLPINMRHDPTRVQAKALELAQLVASGQLRPIIGSRYPLSEAIAAIAHMESRASMGKIIIQP